MCISIFVSRCLSDSDGKRETDRHDMINDVSNEFGNIILTNYIALKSQHGQRQRQKETDKDMQTVYLFRTRRSSSNHKVIYSFFFPFCLLLFLLCFFFIFFFFFFFIYAFTCRSCLVLWTFIFTHQMNDEFNTTNITQSMSLVHLRYADIGRVFFPMLKKWCTFSVMHFFPLNIFFRVFFLGVFMGALTSCIQKKLLKFGCYW